MQRETKLGEGTYSIVYSAKHPEDGQSYAVKRNLVSSITSFIGSLRELDLLVRFASHPNIIHLKFVTIGSPFHNGALSPLQGRVNLRDDSVHFVFEKADEDLFTVLYEKGTVNYGAMKKYAVQLFLALEFLHLSGAIHRDIKPANLLVLNDNLKMSDFGMTKMVTHQDVMTPQIVTAWYRAPEVALNDPQYSFKSDVWSAGCVLYEMITRVALFYDVADQPDLIMNRILSVVPKAPTVGEMFNIEHNPHRKMKVTSAIKIERPTMYQRLIQTLGSNAQIIEDNFGSLATLADLLEHIIVLNDKERYSATQVLDHPIFTEYATYIKEMRQMFPPHPAPCQPYNVIACKEREWAFEIAYFIFNNRGELKWYNHRALFQSIDLFDRYLAAKMPTAKGTIETKEKGKLHTKAETELRYLVCLYISIKLFSIWRAGISYPDIAIELYKTEEALLIAEEFEITLIRDILQYSIYRETIFEAATAKLDEATIAELLLVQGRLTSYNGLQPKQLYEMYYLAKLLRQLKTQNLAV